MSRETENAVLLLLAVAVAMTLVWDVFTRYVKPGLLPWLVASVALLAGLALTAIVADVRRGGPRIGHHGQGRSHRAGTAWLLVLPVVVLIFVTPPALRPTAAHPAATQAVDHRRDRPFPPLPPGPAPEVPLPEVLMRAAHDTTGSLRNRRITVTGFVLDEARGVDLGRVVIVCCAADAQLARIHLSGPAAAGARGLPENTWIRVQGVVTPAARQHNPDMIPTLQVTRLARVDAPANPYAYPR